ncbi:AraC family transcriptional regulator [Flavobacteriaceae bacterium]|nr:AraC family transcriptional regulator [Flavobacteriaceae bacterium]
MMEFNVNPKNNKTAVKMVSEFFQTPIKYGGIDLKRDKLRIKMSNIVLTNFIDISVVEFKVGQNIRVNRIPDPEDNLILMTLSNFTTYYETGDPEKIRNIDKTFQLSLSNTLLPASVVIPANKNFKIVTFRIKKDHFAAYQDIELSRYKQLVLREKPFSFHHFLPYNMELLMKRLYEMTGPRDWRKIMEKSIGLELMAEAYLLMRNNEPLALSDLNPLQLKQALNIQAYILQNLNQNLTVEQIASDFYLSESSLHKLFKKIIHKSPYNYIKSERLKKAKDLLTSSNLPINVISADLCFSSPSHFISSFKKVYGVTPANLRKTTYTTA